MGEIIMSSKIKIFIGVLVMIFILIGGFWIWSSQKISKTPVQDSFENPPLPAQPNCDKEYRFKFDATINTENEFIQFLKAHQFEGNLLKYEPTPDKLIPSNTNQNPIGLDKLKANVEVVKVENSKLSNKRIYIVRIRNQGFHENWPWMITIMMSDKGYVSIRYCAGI